MTRCPTPAVLLGAMAVVALAIGGAIPVAAQPPAPTVTPTTVLSPTAVPTPLPVPDLSGEWSVTRSWVRRCPGCASIVTRTTPWLIVQTGSNVAVNRGPHGVVVGAVGGGAYLSLEGLESGTEGPLRFWYATLFVNADGTWFQGEFAGSERIENPCGREPPLVTCFVSAGTVRAVRTSSGGTPAVPPGAPTITMAAPTVAPASATPGATIVAATPTVIASATAVESETPTALDSPTPSPTRPPLVRTFLPDCRR